MSVQRQRRLAKSHRACIWFTLHQPEPDGEGGLLANGDGRQHSANDDGAQETTVQVEEVADTAASGE